MPWVGRSDAGAGVRGSTGCASDRPALQVRGPALKGGSSLGAVESVADPAGVVASAGHRPAVPGTRSQPAARPCNPRHSRHETRDAPSLNRFRLLRLLLRLDRTTPKIIRTGRPRVIRSTESHRYFRLWLESSADSPSYIDSWSL